MPRVILNSEKYRKEDLHRLIKSKMALKDLNQKDLAKEFMISQPAMSKKICTAQFDLEDLRILFKFLKFSDEEILEVFK